MFLSFRVRIIFLITLIMSITTVVTIYFTRRDVTAALVQVQQDAGRNVLQFVNLNIQNGYHQLLADKISMVVRRKNGQRQIAMGVASVFREYASIAARGHMPPKKARQMAYQWFNGLDYLNRVDRLVFDRDARIMAYSHPSLLECPIASLVDIKGREIHQAMRYDRLNPEGDFAVFRWKTAGLPDWPRKLGFFLPFPEWRVTLVMMIDIEDIEQESERQLRRIVKGLAPSFETLSISENGMAFLFDGNRNILLRSRNSDALHLEQRNEMTGRFLLEDLMAGVTPENGESMAVIRKNGQREVFYTLTSYFKPLDWYAAIVVPESDVLKPAENLNHRLVAAILMVFLAAVFIAVIMATRLAKPLRQLAGYAKRIPDQDFTAPQDTQDAILKRLSSGRKDEVGRLAQAIGFMEESLRANIRELLETAATKERFQSELNVAREIQLGIIPKTFPSFPLIPSLDLYAILRPAKAVGGDLYDFFQVDDDHICFTLGDVSDKGVPAALFMVITRTLIKMAAQKGGEVERIIAHTNDVLSEDNPRAMFVTLIIGLFNFRTGRIVYVNGGHNPPYVLKKDGSVDCRAAISGPVVGVMPGIAYKPMTIDLLPGEAFFLYTDGVNEAMDEDLQQYSNERLARYLENHGTETVREVVEGLMADVADFVGGAAQSDDIAVLMLRYKGATDR